MVSMLLSVMWSACSEHHWAYNQLTSTCWIKGFEEVHLKNIYSLYSGKHLLSFRAQSSHCELFIKLHSEERCLQLNTDPTHSSWCDWVSVLAPALAWVYTGDEPLCSPWTGPSKQIRFGMVFRARNISLCSGARWVVSACDLLLAGHPNPHPSLLEDTYQGQQPEWHTPSWVSLEKMLCSAGKDPLSVVRCACVCVCVNVHVLWVWVCVKLFSADRTLWLWDMHRLIN